MTEPRHIGDADIQSLNDAAEPLRLAALSVLNCTGVAAERLRTDVDDEGLQRPLGMVVELASGIVDPGKLFYRFKHRINIPDATGKTVAYATCTYEVLYDFSPDLEPTAVSVEAFGRTVAAAEIHPYAAETIRDLLARVEIFVPRFSAMKEPLQALTGDMEASTPESA